MNSYISKIRQKLGRQKFIHPACRIIIENDEGEILFIRRKDNGKLGLPAGGVEENETIEECIRRECREKTGIDILRLEVIGISSNPITESVVYPNGDAIQYFTIEFYSNQWTGSLRADHMETIEVAFGDRKRMKELSKNEQSIFESFSYYQRSGKIRVN